MGFFNADPRFWGFVNKRYFIMVILMLNALFLVSISRDIVSPLYLSKVPFFPIVSFSDVIGFLSAMGAVWLGMRPGGVRAV